MLLFYSAQVWHSNEQQNTLCLLKYGQLNIQYIIVVCAEFFMFIKKTCKQSGPLPHRRCLAAAETLETIYYMTACPRGHGDRRCAVIHHHVIRLPRGAEEGHKYIAPRLLPQGFSRQKVQDLNKLWPLGTETAHRNEQKNILQ